MKLESAIRILAGSLVLFSVLLAWQLSPWWILLAVFVGINLIQSAFSGFCPAETLLRKLGIGVSSEACCREQVRGVGLR